MSPILPSETERSRRLCGISPCSSSIDRQRPTASPRWCSAAATSLSARLTRAATMRACARSRTGRFCSVASAWSACSAASLARSAASRADAARMCRRASDCGSGEDVAASRSTAANAASTLGTYSASSSASIAKSDTEGWSTRALLSFPANSRTSERTDQKSGAASRARGFQVGCTANTKAPFNCRRRASRRSLRRSMSQSHAAAQGPVSSAESGPSTTMTSTQTQSALGRLSNNCGISSRNVSGESGAMRHSCLARYRSMNSVRWRNTPTGPGAGQKTHPSQGSAASSNWRRRSCHSRSPTSPRSPAPSSTERTTTPQLLGIVGRRI